MDQQKEKNVKQLLLLPFGTFFRPCPDMSAVPSSPGSAGTGFLSLFLIQATGFAKM
jgi:hypothetical protein